jgi:NAD(P)-dependent dehydrogenase (short-subunit alcohol dehydrogenase family)
MSVIWGVEIFGPLIEHHGEGGQIVSTASMAGLVAITAPAYNVTKYGVMALSEGLRRDLAPRGIGVSVLCPGFVRTDIMTSARKVPARLREAVENALESGPNEAFAQMARQRIATGIDPLYVGELVREAIEGDWPYIFTDIEFEPLFNNRVAEIKAGFDRIRDREPRR